jgi:hypothetical protein
METSDFNKSIAFLYEFAKDGFTFTCNNTSANEDNGIVYFSDGGSFSYDRGVITRIEIYANTKGEGMPGICGSNGWVRTNYEPYSESRTDVWVAWGGPPARSVAFDNGFRMFTGYIEITTLDDR